MENFNSDPKPGRLILPLVLIGMIATTYTFINRVTTNNNLEVINVNDTTAEVVIEDIVEDTTTTSTTTTLPEADVAYLEEIQAEKIQSVELGKKVLETNQRWDDEDTTYQEAQQEFEAFINDAEQFVDTNSNGVWDEGEEIIQDRIDYNNEMYRYLSLVEGQGENGVKPTKRTWIYGGEDQESYGYNSSINYQLNKDFHYYKHTPYY